MDESGLPRLRIVVVGGARNFGARIVRALRWFGPARRSGRNFHFFAGYNASLPLR